MLAHPLIAPVPRRVLALILCVGSGALLASCAPETPGSGARPPGASAAPAAAQTDPAATPQPTDTLVVRGRLVKSDGSAIGGVVADLFAIPEGGDANNPPRRELRTDPEGRFEVRMPASLGQVAGAVDFRVRMREDFLREAKGLRLLAPGPIGAGPVDMGTLTVVIPR
jgi:hypothetical protein